MAERIEKLVEKGLTPRDITLGWLSNRLAPLQQRKHKMCFLSGLDDPTRLSSRHFKLEYLNLWLHHIAKKQPAVEGWEYSLKPFNCSKRPPQVLRALSSCLLFPVSSSSLESLRLTNQLADLFRFVYQSGLEPDWHLLNTVFVLS